VSAALNSAGLMTYESAATAGLVEYFETHSDWICIGQVSDNEVLRPGDVIFIDRKSHAAEYESGAMVDVEYKTEEEYVYEYNGGYDFTAFQWYENGEALSGETRSYLYKPLITGGEYSVLLTEKDGTQLMTCPLIAEKKIELTLYPTVAAPRQQIHCYMSQPGEITLYDAMGRQVLHSIMTSGDNVFEAPFAAGMYTVLVRQKSTDKMKSYKLIIQ
jgi:hypothetical protein